MGSYHDQYPWIREARSEADKWAGLLGTARWPTRAVLFALYGGPRDCEALSRRRDFDRSGKLRRAVLHLIQSGWLVVEGERTGIRIGNVSPEDLEADDPVEIAGWLYGAIQIASSAVEAYRAQKRLRKLYPHDTFPRIGVRRETAGSAKS